MAYIGTQTELVETAKKAKASGDYEKYLQENIKDSKWRDTVRQYMRQTVKTGLTGESGLKEPEHYVSQASSVRYYVNPDTGQKTFRAGEYSEGEVSNNYLNVSGESYKGFSSSNRSITKEDYKRIKEQTKTARKQALTYKIKALDKFMQKQAKLKKEQEKEQEQKKPTLKGIYSPSPNETETKVPAEFIQESPYPPKPKQKPPISTYTKGIELKEMGVSEWYRSLGDRAEFTAKYRSDDMSGFKKMGYTLLGGTTSASSVFTQTFLHPIETAKGWGKSILHPVETIRGVVKGLEETPAQTIGGFVGSYYSFRVVSTVAPKVTYEKINIPTSKGNVKGYTVGIKTPDVFQKASVKGDIPILTKVTTESITRSGKNLKVQRSSTGQFWQIGKKVPESEFYFFGKKGITARVKPETITGQGVPQPTTGPAYKTFNKLIQETPKERLRTDTFLKIGRRLQYEKGQPVKDFVINIEGVKNPKKVSKIIDQFMAENKGDYFGSLTTKQLPKKGGVDFPEIEVINGKTTIGKGKVKVTKGYQNIKQGDIDAYFHTKTVQEISPLLDKLAKKLQDAGEDIGVSKAGHNVLEFKKGEFAGAKFMEAKSGINQDILGLGDEASAGIGGYTFANLKQGQKTKTVPFGEARAITAGEQTMRKGAGTLIVSPGKPGETASFSEAGILGKQVNPRGLKDTAGFIQGVKGIAEIKKARTNPLQKLSAGKLTKLSDKFIKTYTGPQQVDLQLKLKSLVGDKIPLTSSTTKSVTTSPSVSLPGSFSSLSTASPSPSPISSPVSRGTEILNNKIPISSPYKREIPSKTSLSPSKVSSLASGFLSTLSPSPATSPSPISSPVSPSPFTSPSPSPATSPSPISSPVSPSPFTSPSPSPSPFTRIPPTKQMTSPFNNKKNRSRGKYSVEVKKRGIWQEIGQYESPRSAFIFGKLAVERTARASLRVKNIFGSENLGGIASEVLPQRVFRRSKIFSDVFIQRRQFRISSPGEKFEITAKGIQAQRNKKKKRGLFDIKIKGGLFN